MVKLASPPTIHVSRTESPPEQDGTYFTFCTAEIKISKDCPSNFYLRLVRNKKEKGVILTPCIKFDGTTIGNSKAIYLYSKEYEKTNWSVSFKHDSIENKRSLHFECQGSTDSRDNTIIEFGAKITDFEGIKFEYSSDDRHWEECDVSGGNSPIKGSAERARHQWVTDIIKGVTKTKATKNRYPLFHLKQQATLKALSKVKSNINCLTYVGPDDVANLLSAISNVIVNEQPKESTEIVIRLADGQDELTETEYLEEKLKEILGSNFSGPSSRNHDDKWDKTDLIIDTYTAIAWGKTDKDVLNELNFRVESLNDGGRLVLVYPIFNEPFFVGSETPKFLRDNIMKTKKGKITGAEEIVLYDASDIGNTRYAVLGKPEATTGGGPEVSAGTSEYDDSANPMIEKPKVELPLSDVSEKPHSNDFVPSASKVEEEKQGKQPTRIRNWADFVRACKLKNPGSVPSRPFSLPIVGKIRTYLEKIEVDRNVLLIQANPGWGKTSLVGDALFPDDNDINSEPKVWFGSLDQLNHYSKFTDKAEIESSILILDDLHEELYDDERNARDESEVVNIIREISARAKAIIITCRVQEWGGRLCQQLDEISEPFENHIFPEWETDEVAKFALYLRKKAGCDVPIGHKMHTASVVWCARIKRKLFSIININSKGLDYSPRIAISWMRQQRLEFDDTTTPIDYDQIQFDDDDDDDLGYFAV